MDAVVERLHECLVDAIRRRRPDVDAEPVTVAEIYQEYVPYRSVRPTLGVELNADYEFALLRLLSGEGGRVRLEPEEAREALRREAEQRNPDVGLYRRFAGCEAWIAPAPARAFAPASGMPPVSQEDEGWTPPAWMAEEAAATGEAAEVDTETGAVMAASPPAADAAADVDAATAGATADAAGAPASGRDGYGVAEQLEAAPGAADDGEPAAEAFADAYTAQGAAAPAAPTVVPEGGAATVDGETLQGEAPRVPALDEAEATLPASGFIGPAGEPEAAAVLPTLEREMPQAGAAQQPGACVFCHEALPARPVRYCPHCGTDQTLLPCAACGEVLERGWRYCITCGLPTGTTSA